MKCIFDKTYEIKGLDNIELPIDYEPNILVEDVLKRFQQREKETTFILNQKKIEKCNELMKICKMIAKNNGLRLAIFENEFKDIEIQLYINFMPFGMFKTEFAKVFLLCDNFTIDPINKDLTTIIFDISQADKYYDGRKIN